jgi:23S rRNA (pseudouridine1915-N3)-methyltransferase
VRLVIIAVCQRQPNWIQQGWAEYAKRFPPELQIELKTIRVESRSGGKTPAQCMAAEHSRITEALPRRAYVVALDERGTALTTRALATKLSQWQLIGSDIALLIGGPDGLNPALRVAAHECIRLSDLTLPHGLARVLLTEQLYRAWSINAGHPYHRE